MGLKKKKPAEKVVEKVENKDQEVISELTNTLNEETLKSLIEDYENAINTLEYKRETLEKKMKNIEDEIKYTDLAIDSLYDKLGELKQ